jgi:hypothetical protein
MASFSSKVNAWRHPFVSQFQHDTPIGLIQKKKKKEKKVKY